jgi:transposase
VVKPRQVRDVAKATGQRAHTAARDAQTRAHVTELIRPERRPLSDEQPPALAALLARRWPRVETLTAEKTCLGRARTPWRTSLRAPIAWRICGTSAR